MIKTVYYSISLAFPWHILMTDLIVHDVICAGCCELVKPILRLFGVRMYYNINLCHQQFSDRVF